ncbi:hypothetical protein FF1_025118 [Malus domestica]
MSVWTSWMLVSCESTRTRGRVGSDTAPETSLLLESDPIEVFNHLLVLSVSDYEFPSESSLKPESAGNCRSLSTLSSRTPLSEEMAVN